MSESDLDDLLKDLDIPDAGAEGGDEGGSVEAGGDLGAADDSGGGETAGEGIELDDDMQAAFGGGDEGDEGGTAQGDDDLTSSLMEELGVDDAGGGEAAEEDMSALADSLGGGESAPAAGPAMPMGLVGVDRDSVNVEFLLEIKLHVTFEVGRAKMLISDLLTLGQGSVVELHRLVGDELDFLVNGKLVAKGEVVVVNEKFGCRISSIIPPEDRVKYLA